MTCTRRRLVRSTGGDGMEGGGFRREEISRVGGEETDVWSAGFNVYQGGVVRTSFSRELVALSVILCLHASYLF